MSILLNSLNDKQREAVTTTEGPVLVIAGAGSGKTRALTHRIAYLIQEKKVNPWNILAVTFTNKAAGEMKERLAILLGVKERSAMQGEGDDPSRQGGRDVFNSPYLPTAGTFHSICVRILRKQLHLLNFENSFTIFDTADQLILMKRVMRDSGFDEKELNPKAVLSHISNAKNQLVGPERFASMVDSHFASKVSEIYGPYQKALKANNALDFDDILMKTVELFQKFPAVLAEYQGKFRYISVDEYQDTNHAQYLLIKMLAEKYHNLCVIGDSDQSIYSWRGANIQNILDFEKDYPDAKVIKLEQN
ncbi:MAG: UvrD-helicase domain-containing protein, partial [Patescibacteria group bacterium]